MHRFNHRLLDLRLYKGGEIDIAITGSLDTFNNRLLNHRLLDLGTRCPSITITGSLDTFNNRLPNARFLDLTYSRCLKLGVCITGSLDTFNNKLG